MIMYLNRYEYDMLMMMSEEGSERKIQALLVSYCVIRKTILSLVGEGKWCGYPRRLAKKRRFGSFVERQKQGSDRGGGGGRVAMVLEERVFSCSRPSHTSH
jgi:hypothetical protein